MASLQRSNDSEGKLSRDRSMLQKCHVFGGEIRAREGSKGRQPSRMIQLWILEHGRVSKTIQTEVKEWDGGGRQEGGGSILIAMHREIGPPQEILRPERVCRINHPHVGMGHLAREKKQLPQSGATVQPLSSSCGGFKPGRG